MDDDPAQRLRRAYMAAIDRYAAKETEGIDPDTFEELGESLFWLIAFAEAKGCHRSTDLLLGLTWARNGVAHGELLTEQVEWHYGTELDRWVVGRGVLGTQSRHEWLKRDLIQTSQRSDSEGEATYDGHLAGRPVLETIRAGQAEVDSR